MNFVREAVSMENIGPVPPPVMLLSDGGHMENLGILPLLKKKSQEDYRSRRQWLSWWEVLRTSSSESVDARPYQVELFIYWRGWSRRHFRPVGEFCETAKTKWKKTTTLQVCIWKIFIWVFISFPFVVDALASAWMSRYIGGLHGVFSCKTLIVPWRFFLGILPLFCYHAKEFLLVKNVYVLGRGACRGTPWDFS